MLAGANMIYGAGMLELGMTFSPAQYVADDEIIRMLSRILRGIPTDDEHLAVDIIKEVGCGGEFLSHPHTFQNLRHNIFPEMIDRDDRETWNMMGKKTLAASAREKAIDIINRLTSSLQVRPFDFIRRTDPAHLLNFIQQEYPQTIALILAYLEPGKAAVIMQNLPEDMQAEVSKRLATMDRTSPDVLREVERVLEKKLSTLSSEDYTAAGGVEAIVDILNLVDRSSEKAIIESLEEENPDLAEDIKKRMFVFEDIVMLDDRAIQKVLREVDTQELAKALKNVDAEVQDKIYRNMSKRAASMLKEDMEFMGPVRVKDVEEAQQKIVAVIRRLEESGEIVIARSGEDEMVV